MPIELPASPTEPPRPFALNGRMVAAALVIFFLVVVAANATMLTMALRTMPGVDVKSAYETSQRFNGEIARMHDQAARGWQAQVAIARTGAGAALAVDLRDRNGAALDGLSVRARLERPATRQEDREANLTETATGRYEAQIADLHAGGWTLALEARRGDETLFVSRSRILLRD